MIQKVIQTVIQKVIQKKLNCASKNIQNEIQWGYKIDSKLDSINSKHSKVYSQGDSKNIQN